MVCVNFILCVIYSIVIFDCVSLIIVFSIFFIILGLSVDVGLLNNIIFGFIYSECVMVMCCCWLFEICLGNLCVCLVIFICLR